MSYEIDETDETADIDEAVDILEQLLLDPRLMDHQRNALGLAVDYLMDARD